MRNSKVKENKKQYALIVTSTGIVLVESEEDYRVHTSSFSLCDKCILRGICGYLR